MKSRAATMLAWGIILSACGAGATADGMEDMASCSATSSEAITELSSIPAGFTQSAQSLLESATGSFSGTLTRTDASTSGIVLSIERTGDVTLEDREWTDSEGSSLGMEPAIGTGDCLDALVFPATVTVVSGSSLNESFTTEVTIDTSGTGTLTLSKDEADLVGDASPDSFDPADLASTEFLGSATLGSEGWAGEFTFLGTSEPSGDDSNSTVSATNDPWGTFEVVHPSGE